MDLLNHPTIQVKFLEKLSSGLKKSCAWSALGHLILSLILYYLNYTQWSLLNILCILYLALIIQSIDKQKTLFAFSFISIYWLLYSNVSIYFFGWESGFQYYLLLLICLQIYHKPQSRINIYIIELLIVLNYFIAYYYFRTSSFSFNDSHSQLLYILNTLNFFILLGINSSAFYRANIDRESTFHTLANTDPLTLVPNRRQLMERLKQYHSESAFQYIGIVFVDIDHFKQINDTYGHSYGDEVLKAFAQLLRREIRKNDLVGRWGGEEFLLILTETTREEAQAIVERVRKTIEAQPFGALKIKVTATFGIHILDHEQSISEALNLADYALYKGKALGRNRVICG